MLTYVCLQSQDSKINVGLPEVGNYPGLWCQILPHTNNKTQQKVPDTAVHTYNSRIWESEGRNQKCNAILNYMANPVLAWPIFCLQYQTKQKQN